MTPEQINVAIAKVCGHTFDYWPDGSGRFSVVKDNTYVQLPDYHSDLNAMHEAEATLSDKTDNGLGSIRHSSKRGRYELHLESITRSFEIWHATAAQRAEAFLRTLNLWEVTP